MAVRLTQTWPGAPRTVRAPSKTSPLSPSPPTSASLLLREPADQKRQCRSQRQGATRWLVVRGSSTDAADRVRPELLRYSSVVETAAGRSSGEPARASCRALSSGRKQECARRQEIRAFSAGAGDRAGIIAAWLREAVADCSAAAARRAGYGLASRMRLNGVSVARRTRVNPPCLSTSVSCASPAWAPSARPTSWASDAGVQITVEAP